VERRMHEAASATAAVSPSGGNCRRQGGESWTVESRRCLAKLDPRAYTSGLDFRSLTLRETWGFRPLA